MEALSATFLAHTDLAALLPTWRIQKSLFNRYQPWQAGGLIAATGTANPTHENVVSRFEWGILVAWAFPTDGNTGNQTQLENMLAIDEWMAITFSFTGKNRAPAPIAALDSSFPEADPHHFTFEGVSVQDGSPFVEGAIRSNFDANARHLIFKVNIPKPDNSSLGA